MKIIFRFIRPHWKLFLLTMLMLVIDAGGALYIPTLEGDSGIVDLGITMRSKPTDPMALDLGLKGYVGDYQGVTGTVTWRYAF